MLEDQDNGSVPSIFTKPVDEEAFVRPIVQLTARREAPESMEAVP